MSPLPEEPVEGRVMSKYISTCMSVISCMTTLGLTNSGTPVNDEQTLSRAQTDTMIMHLAAREPHPESIDYIHAVNSWLSSNHRAPSPKPDSIRYMSVQYTFDRNGYIKNVEVAGDKDTTFSKETGTRDSTLLQHRPAQKNCSTLPVQCTLPSPPSNRTTTKVIILSVGSIAIIPN